MNVENEIRRYFRVKQFDTVPYKGWKNSTRADLYVLFAKLGYKTGVEVGASRGVNANDMHETIPNLNLTLVDPWVAFGRNSAEHMERVYQKCRKRLKRWNPTYIRKPSVEGVKDIQDESIDFVYIDGMHDFDSVMMDIIVWTPKVKRGGIVSGHDFFYGYSPYSGVIEAVRAYTYAHNITEWHITGSNRPWRGSSNGEPQSFFWAKT